MASLYQQAIDWYKAKYPMVCDNTPSKESEHYLHQIVTTILRPVEEQFGQVTITYGFVGYELNKHIQKHSPSGTCPNIDQHSSCELNSKNKHICLRQGASVDVIVKGFEQDMHLIARFIVENLSFDKLYFYGRNRPIHISVSASPSRHLQIMQIGKTGRRYPGKKACGTNAKSLAAEL